MSVLNLILPGLIWSSNLDNVSEELTTKYWQKILTRAKSSELDLNYSDFYYGLIEGGVGQSVAQRYAKKLNLTQYSNYLIVEPTHLRLDRDRLLFSEAGLLQLNTQESMSIISALNQHFAPKLEFYYIREDLWLVGTNLLTKDELISYPLIDIIGEDANDFIQATHFKLANYLNEIQMLLFNLALNQQREQDGLLTINSLWLWDKELKRLPFELADFSLNQLPLATKSINNVLIDQLYYSNRYLDKVTWLAKMQELDIRIAKLLLKQLITGKFKQVNLYVPMLDKTLRFSLNRFMLWKFWHKQSWNDLLVQLTK